jgi:outer membrane protein OmpA-like peptidoglycan-associated protein
MSAAAQLVELDPSGCSGYTWMAMLSSLASQGSEALSNARGRGELVPTAPNSKPDGSDNSDGRALNRRVEILFGG